ncbi:MAG: TraR/DksA family transcriptional regulator [Acidimicrobiia bacterium]
MGQSALSPSVLTSLRTQLLDALDFHKGRLAEYGDGDDHDLYLAMQRRSLRAQEEINTALNRMGEGDYGVCVSCQSDISLQRLTAVPHALTCAGCALS